VIERAHDRVDQVADEKETAPIAYRRERQREAALDQADEALEVALCPGTVDQGRPQYDQLRIRSGEYRGDGALAVQLGTRIGCRGRRWSRLAEGRARAPIARPVIPSVARTYRPAPEDAASRTRKAPPITAGSCSAPSTEGTDPAGRRVSACRKRRTSPRAMAAPAFLCAALPRDATITASARPRATTTVRS
jgi:hypothetical protein